MDVRVDTPGLVKIVVFNIAGEQVAVVLDQFLPAGNHRAYWDGHNRFADILGNGVYIIYIKTPSGRFFQKVIILK